MKEPRPPHRKHRIRQQTLELEADSERLALRLQPRLESLNRRRLVPLIERLLDEVSPPGQRIRLDRLEVDLGTLPEGEGFEREAERRLERELRRVLREEVQRAMRDPRPERRSLPERAYRSELLEHYLVRGTVPYWGPAPGDFSLETLVTEMLETAPEDLARTVRHLGHRTRVLERLVLQLSEPLLRRLIRLLAPEHAALILAYLVDLRQVHRAERLVPLSEPRFVQTLWLLTQIYLLQDPGSQFNRRSFLRSLLEGLATGQGLDYSRILETLAKALERTRRRRSLQSSLPAVVAELVRELGRELGRDSEEVADLDASRESDLAGPEDLDALLAALAGLDTRPDGDSMAPAATVEPAAPTTTVAGEWIRRLAGRLQPGPAVVTRRLLEELPPEKLLAVLAPAHRDWIAELVRTRAHDGVRDATLWESVLDVLVHRGASGWSAGELLQRLLRRMAERAGVGGAPAAAEASLARELDETLAADASAAASPAGRKLARALDEMQRRTKSRPPTPRAVAETPGDASGRGDRPFAGLGRYELVDSLRHLLRFGMLPWTDLLHSPDRTPDRVLSGLARLPRSLLRAALAADSPAQEDRLRRRLARALPEDLLGQILLRLLPATAAPDHPFRTALAEHATRAASRRQFLAGALLDALQGRPLDLEGLVAKSEPATRDAGVEPEAAMELGPDLEAWPASALQAALLTRLRFGTLEGTAPEGLDTEGLDTEGLDTRRLDSRHLDSQGPAEISPRLLQDAPAAIREIPLAQLLTLLVETHPEDAEEMLRSLRERRHLWVALMRRLPLPVVDRLLSWLAPETKSTLTALQDALVSIPIPHRPGSPERIAPVILGEVLRAGRDALLSEAFFAHVLRELFGPRLPEEAHRHLAQEAQDWKTSGRLPAASRRVHAAVFTSALATAAARSGEGPGAGTAAQRSDRPAVATGQATARAARRDAVFTFLLGKPLLGQPTEGAVATEAAPLGRLSRSSLEGLLRELARRSPEELRRFLHRHLGTRELRERWARELSESALARLAAVLEPRWSATLLDTAELLASSALEAAFPGARKIASRAALWSFALDFFHRQGGADRLFERWVVAFFDHVADRAPKGDPDQARAVGAALWEAAGRLAQTAGHARLRALLHRDRARLLARFQSRGQPGGRAAADEIPVPDRDREEPVRPRKPRRPPEDSRKTAFGLEGEDRDGDLEDPIYLDNAGLVLTGPFLPQLFGALDLLERDEDGKMQIKDRDSASRAVHLLQYLVDGRTSAPEPLLVLNKLLSGVPLGAPVAREIEPTDEERGTCDKLLRSMLANWEVLSGTSVAGLRETFLQREGRLVKSDEGWKLKVQRKTVDVLVDQVPWSISVVLQNWMPEPIYVEW